MIVVADASPLNYLIRLACPDILREIYGRVMVPHAVLVEMQHAEAPSEVRAWASAPPHGLKRDRRYISMRVLLPSSGPGKGKQLALPLR